MARKAEALAELLPMLSRGRSKATGQPFYIVPASNRLSAHWTAVDGSGCTCIGYQRRGICAHAVAARSLHDSQQQPAPAPSRPTYEALYPACKSGCGDVAETRDGYCDRCASDREWQQRMVARRELVTV